MGVKIKATGGSNLDIDNNTESFDNIMSLVFEKYSLFLLHL